jgi:hypothetical protein
MKCVICRRFVKDDGFAAQMTRPQMHAAAGTMIVTAVVQKKLAGDT